MERTVTVKNLQIGVGKPLTIIAGPCVVENREMIFQTAEEALKAVRDLPVQFIFKSSYKKANRTSLQGFTGIGFHRALDILQEVRNKFRMPVLTDVHTEVEIPEAAACVDMLQIPAFLCRQTDLLLAAGKTGLPVNIKKGQFLAPEDMAAAAEKVAAAGNRNILLTERGASFGYHNLVVDMRSLVVMSRIGYPVVFDATHSVQLPGGEGNASGGQPEFILPLARAAVATGAVNAVFMEIHPNPPEALSDARSQLRLSRFKEVVERLLEIYECVRQKQGGP